MSWSVFALSGEPFTWTLPPTYSTSPGATPSMWAPTVHALSLMACAAR